MIYKFNKKQKGWIVANVRGFSHGELNDEPWEGFSIGTKFYLWEHVSPAINEDAIINGKASLFFNFVAKRSLLHKHQHYVHSGKKDEILEYCRRRL